MKTGPTGFLTPTFVPEDYLHLSHLGSMCNLQVSLWHEEDMMTDVQWCEEMRDYRDLKY